MSKRKVQRIALANPRDSAVPKEVYAVYEHLGLGLLAAVLREKGYQVVVFDACAKDWSIAETVAHVLPFSPDVFGLTCTYQTYPDALELAKQAKANANSVHVTLGGEHATFSSKDILSAENVVDTVVRGEGEKTIVELLQNLGEGGDLAQVEGIHFRDGNGVHENPDRRAIEDLDSIPFAARDTLDHCLAEGKTAAIGMLATRGCRWNCHFCNANRFLRMGGGNAQRRRSPENVVDEIELLHRDYFSRGLLGRVYFYDAVFVENTRSSKRWAKRFAEEMTARSMRVPFEIYARVDSFSEEDTQLINLLKRAGLVEVFLGLESGSQETLDALNKKATVDQNAKALALLEHHGISGATHGFIMFNPYVSFQGLRNSVALLAHTGQASLWNMSQKLQIFPGTALLENLKREGLLLPGYTHTDVYEYRCREPRIGPLADELFRVNTHPVSIRENSLARYIRTTANEVYSMAVGAGVFAGNPRTELSRLKKEIDRKQAEICDLNRDFVLRSVSLAEAGWVQTEFEDAKERYLDSLSSQLDSVNASFEEFLTFVDENVTQA